MACSARVGRMASGPDGDLGVGDSVASAARGRRSPLRRSAALDRDTAGGGPEHRTGSRRAAEAVAGARVAVSAD